MAKKVAVIMGSDSDFDVVSAAIDTLLPEIEKKESKS